MYPKFTFTTTLKNTYMEKGCTSRTVLLQNGGFCSCKHSLHEKTNIIQNTRRKTLHFLLLKSFIRSNCETTYHYTTLPCIMQKNRFVLQLFQNLPLCGRTLRTTETKNWCILHWFKYCLVIFVDV